MKRVILSYENGVLKPGEDVRLADREICMVSVYPDDQCRKDFDARLKRTHQRTRLTTPQEIEAVFTAARVEGRAKRPATHRAV